MDSNFNLQDNQPPLPPNEEKLSAAQIFFKDKQVLTARPEGMPFTDYRILRAHQNRLTRILFRKPANPKIIQAMGLRFGYNQHVR